MTFVLSFGMVKLFKILTSDNSPPPPPHPTNCESCLFYQIRSTEPPPDCTSGIKGERNAIKVGEHCTMASLNKEDCHTASGNLAHGQLEPLAYCKDCNNCDHVVCKCTKYDSCWQR